MSDSERLEKGQIHSRVIIEVLGKPKEYVEKAIKNYIEKIKQDDNITVVKEDLADTKEQEGMWINFVEMEIWTKGIAEMINFCFDYMPSSIEIIEPKEFNLKSHVFAGFLNDLQGRLHRLNTVVKQIGNENLSLKKNTETLISNIISVMALKDGKTVEQFSKVIGLTQESMQKLLDKMIEDKRLKKEGDKYFLIR